MYKKWKTRSFFFLFRFPKKNLEVCLNMCNFAAEKITYEGRIGQIGILIK